MGVLLLEKDPTNSEALRFLAMDSFENLSEQTIGIAISLFETIYRECNGWADSEIMLRLGICYASAGDVCVSSQSVAGVPPRPAPAAARSLVRPIRPPSQSPACPAEVWRRASHGVPAASLRSLLAFPVPARAALGRERRVGRPSQPPGAACAPPHAHSRASARFKKSAQRRRRLCGSPVVV